MIKRLYHGTTYLFDSIDVSKGKGYKDFGKGFYLSGTRSHSESLAKRNREIAQTRSDKLGERVIHTAYLYKYDFDTSLLAQLSVKEFECDTQQNILEWVRFVDANRSCPTKTHNFDIVRGATADDGTSVSFSLYHQGVYGARGSDKALLRLVDELQIERLPAQWFFGTQKATDMLKFVGRERI